jgi:1-acyl-sn-glycerol-3-phosphate acyltransferase
MILIRSLLFFTFMVITTVIIATLGTLFAGFLPRKKRHIFDNSWSHLNLWALSFFCNLDYRISGLENLPEGSFIVFAKHQSAWETIALITLIPGAKAWVLKRELLFVPFFGWIMWHFKPIAIDRKSGRKAADQIIEQGKEKLDQGINIIIFPEGTRVAPGTRKRYGIGGALLAEKSEYPVVPLAHNAGVFWRRRDLKKYPGTVDVAIGPVIETKELTAAEINTKAEAWIEETVEKMPKERSL